MGIIKAFLLGVCTAYGIYFVAKRRPDGTSILDELLENPVFYINKVKDYAIQEAVKKIKDQIG